MNLTTVISELRSMVLNLERVINSLESSYRKEAASKAPRNCLMFRQSASNVGRHEGYVSVAERKT